MSLTVSALWTLAGLSVNLAGAMLLSVEAIKIKNILRLRDTLFAGLAGRATSPPVQLPPFELVGDKAGQVALGPKPQPEPKAEYVTAIPEWRHRRGLLSLSFPPFYWVWHLGIPILFWISVEFAVRWLTSFSLFGAWLDLWWPLKVLSVLFLLVSLVPLFFILGCGIHRLIFWFAMTCIDQLNRLEARTQSGVIGVLGFVLMLIGFACQALGTLLGS